MWPKGARFYRDISREKHALYCVKPSNLCRPNPCRNVLMNVTTQTAKKTLMPPQPVKPSISYTTSLCVSGSQWWCSRCWYQRTRRRVWCSPQLCIALRRQQVSAELQPIITTLTFKRKTKPSKYNIKEIPSINSNNNNPIILRLPCSCQRQGCLSHVTSSGYRALQMYMWIKCKEMWCLISVQNIRLYHFQMSSTPMHFILCTVYIKMKCMWCFSIH